MDESLEALRRARRLDPRDVATNLRFALALERADRFWEAWDVLLAFETSKTALERDEARAGLGALAARNAGKVLERLRGLDYRSARLLIGLLMQCGQARNPALIAIASDADADPILRQHAWHSIATTLEGDLEELREVPPEQFLRLIEEGALPNSVADQPLSKAQERARVERRKRWQGYARRLVDKEGAAQAAALLPWLVPLLATRDRALRKRALAVVRRLTDRDGPPFDADALERIMRTEGEASDPGEVA